MTREKVGQWLPKNDRRYRSAARHPICDPQVVVCYAQVWWTQTGYIQLNLHANEMSQSICLDSGPGSHAREQIICQWSCAHTLPLAQADVFIFGGRAYKAPSKMYTYFRLHCTGVCWRLSRSLAVRNSSPWVLLSLEIDLVVRWSHSGMTILGRGARS